MAIARTGRPFGTIVTRSRAADGTWMYRWSVPLSETPGADWIQVFREAPGPPELSPSAARMQPTLVA